MDAPLAKRPRSWDRRLRALRQAGKTAGLIATFSAALGAGVALHARTAAFRRSAVAIGNRVMGDLFQGKIVVHDVDMLELGRIGKLHAGRVEVFDPEGKIVVVANGVTSSIDLDRLIDALAAGKPPVVAIGATTIDDVEVVLDVHPSGTPNIARAFASRPTSAPAPSLPPLTPKSSGPTVRVPEARIGHAHVHGNIVPPNLDGDVDGVVATFALEDGAAKIEMVRGKATLRSPRAPSQNADLVGQASGAMTVALATTRIVGNARFDGAAGGVPIEATAKLDGDVVDATLEVRSTPHEAIAAAFPSVPLRQTTELHATVHGKLPQLAIDVKGRAGKGSLAAKGEIDLTAKHAFKVDAEASHIDVRAFGADVDSDLSGTVHAEGTLGPDVPSGTFRVTTSAGSVGTEKIPALVVDGHVDAPRIVATVTATEPGVSASGDVAFDVSSQVATFDITARSSSLRALSRAPNLVSGSASVRARGKADVGRGTLQATADVTANDLAIDALSTKHLTATATATGPLAKPVIDVGFQAEDMEVTAKGKAPLVYPEASGRARVELVPTPRIVGASIHIGKTGGADAVAASAREIHFRNGGVEARGLEVSGLGEPLEVDVRMGGGQWHVVARSAGVDMHRLAAVTGIKELELLPEGSRATLDVDVRQESSGADGHVDVKVVSPKGAFGLGALVAEVHANVDRGKLVGGGKVSAEGFGEVEISADVDVPGRLDPKALSRTTGTIELRGHADLSQGAALFAGENVERVTGIASFEVRIERGDPTTLPVVRGTVRTEGLEVAMTGAPPTETLLFSGVDLQGHVSWDGSSNDAEVAFVSWDKHGLLGSGGAKAKIPVLAWATGTKPDARAIGAMVIGAALDVPSRDIAELPSLLRSPDLRGRIEARVRASGSIEAPHVTVSARAEGIDEALTTVNEPSFQPLDGLLEADWDGTRAAVTFALDERRRTRKPREREPRSGPKAAMRGPPPPRSQAISKKQGHLRGLVLVTDIQTSELLEGRPLSRLGWRASTEVEVDSLALAALRLPTGLTGTLTGRARVRDVNHDPSFEANAHIDGFGSTGVKVSKVDVTVGGRDKSLFAHATVQDTKSKAVLQLASQSLRIQGFDLSWEPTSPTRVDYAVENGRLALVAPLVKKSISEIDGRVDGAGSISIDQDGQVFEGGLAIHEGSLYVNALGEEITNLAAIARFERSGEWKIENASGTIGGGALEASASGRMKGLAFVGAEARLVATKEGIPISAEGATFAEATGEVKLTAKMDEANRSLVLTVDVPRADVQLPDRSTQQLEPLEPEPTIAVGVRKKNGELDRSAVRKNRGGTGKNGAIASKATVTRMTVTLGDDVRLEGRGIDVTLGGRTLVEIADEVKVTGRIDLRGGTAIVHGRRFTVDRGTVTFPEGGDESNPTIVAAAYWDAPDRTRVWVEFAGPLKTGNITLRSEPALNKNAILSVLLFGRPDPNQAAPGATPTKSDSTGGATAVGSGFVAGDINRLLSQIDENLDIETDTLSGNRTRTKLGRSFFDRRLKVQVGYAPGRTTYREPDTTFVFLNWQFVPKWSLQATRGNRGTSILDVLFQHRY